jgi:hypothetical protein
MTTRHEIEVYAHGSEEGADIVRERIGALDRREMTAFRDEGATVSPRAG